MKQFEADQNLIVQAATLAEQGQLIYIDTRNNRIVETQEIEGEKIPEHLLPVVPMSSKEYFDLMKDFGCTIDDMEFRALLYDLLSRDHPFSRFKEFIESSDYRQQWYAFRHQNYKKHVERQINDFNLIKRITEQ